VFAYTWQEVAIVGAIAVIAIVQLGRRWRARKR
jgi:hypothetical protein